MPEKVLSTPSKFGRLLLPILSFAFLTTAIFAASNYLRNAGNTSASGVVVEINADNYEREVLKSKIPVIVEISSTDRGACVAEEPVFKKMSAKYAGKVKFVRVNQQDEPALVKNLGVTQELTVMLPIHVVLKYAQPVLRMPGYLNEEELESVIELGMSRPPKLI